MHQKTSIIPIHEQNCRKYTDAKGNRLISNTIDPKPIDYCPTDCAQGRLPDRTPISIVDIGSNSVRLVVYEGLSRSPTVLFNEKVLCGLGRGIASTGRLDQKAVDCAIAALTRYRALSVQAGANKIHAIATAAAREAENGAEFIQRANKSLGVDVHVLSGREEAYYAAMGVNCGFPDPDGISGDLGGGSLELVDIHGEEFGAGITVPLGGLRLQEMSGGSVRKARKIARDILADIDFLEDGRKRTFYAVGGTWRSLAKLHIAYTNHPLHVTHNYEMSATQTKKFCKLVIRSDLASIPGMETVSSNRRQLLPFGAIVLDELVARMRPKNIVISALGVREGYLYSLLDEETRKLDPLVVACEELSRLRSRSPQHAYELAEWTGSAFETFGIDESPYEARLRVAACLLADIGWRAHPEYRGEQSLNIISNAAFIGVDHPGRAYLALANFYRHEGLRDAHLSPSIHQLANKRIAWRARVLGAILRVAYQYSASMPGNTTQIKFSKISRRRYTLDIPEELDVLLGERPGRRLKQLAKLLNVEIEVRVC